MLFSFLLRCLFFCARRCHLLVWWWKTSATTSSLPLLFPSSFLILPYCIFWSFLFGCTSRRHAVCKQTHPQSITTRASSHHQKWSLNKHHCNKPTNQPTLYYKCKQTQTGFCCCKNRFINFKLHVRSLPITTPRNNDEFKLDYFIQHIIQELF
jgi:hypothetical protein